MKPASDMRLAWDTHATPVDTVVVLVTGVTWLYDEQKAEAEDFGGQFWLTCEQFIVDVVFGFTALVLAAPISNAMEGETHDNEQLRGNDLCV